MKSLTRLGTAELHSMLGSTLLRRRALQPKAQAYQGQRVNGALFSSIEGAAANLTWIGEFELILRLSMRLRPPVSGRKEWPMEGDATYFARRANEERAAALKAAHPTARRCHLELARRYDELAGAVAPRLAMSATA